MLNDDNTNAQGAAPLLLIKKQWENVSNLHCIYLINLIYFIYEYMLFY